MAKTPCKGIKKDGTPCQGHGLPQYNGLCIAHGPTPDQTHQWRSLGGQNSSTAARLDKRTPERLKNAIDLINDAIVQVAQGEMDPARLNAMSRGAKALLDLHTFGDRDMETIRREETEQAAAQLLGIPGNLDLLETADHIAARQDRYRSQSLVDQGLAELVPSPDPDQPPQTVLTEEGRRRFGYRRPCQCTQAYIDDWNSLLDFDLFEITAYPDIDEELAGMEAGIEQALASADLQPSPPPDPLTGQPMTELPTGVKVSLEEEYFAPGAGPSKESLEDLHSQFTQLKDRINNIDWSLFSDRLGIRAAPSQASNSNTPLTELDTNGESPRPEPSWP